MAEQDVILNLEVSTGDSVNELEAVEQQFTKIDATAEETGETIAAMTKKMELYKSAALKAGASSPIGKEAIKRASELQGELDKVNELVNRNNEDFDKFRSVVSIGTTAINSYAAFESVTALAGVENEKLLQTMVKLQAAQQLLNSLEAARTSLLQKNAVITKGLAIVQKGYAFAVGSSTGALKLFRLALIATGIGAFVVLLGVLIANWDKFKEAVDNNTEAFKKFKKVLLVIAPPIWAIIKAAEALKGVLQDLGIAQSEQAEQMVKDSEKRLEALQEEEAAINSKYNFEIAKAQAAGESTFELEQEKTKALMDRIKAEAKAIVMLAKLNGEFTDEQKERVRELADQFKKLAQDSVVNRIKQEKKETDAYKKELDKRAKAGEKAAQEKQKRLDEEIARQDEQFILLNELTLSAQDQEIALLVQGYDEKFALAEGNAELEKALKIKQGEEIAEIEQRFADEKLAREAEAAFSLMELRLELKELNAGELSDDASPEEVAEYYEQRNEIEDEQRELAQEKLATDLELGTVTEQEAALRSDIIEKTSAKNKKKIAEEEAAFKKKVRDQEVAGAIAGASNILSSVASLAEEGSSMAKAAAVGQATMDTYKSATAAYAAGSSLPGPAGIVGGPLAAGLAVAAGIKNVQKIISTKTPGGGGGGGGGLSTPTAGTFQTISAPSPDNSLNPDGTLTDSLLNPPEEPPLKVTVLESDIQRATESNAQSVETSEL